MLNSIDGMREDTEKTMGPKLQGLVLGRYENVRITDVLNASKFNWQSEKMVASKIFQKSQICKVMIRRQKSRK